MTVYDRGEFEKAHARLRSAPGELTMGDIEQLTAFSPDLGRQGLAARTAALSLAPASVAAPSPAPAAKRGLSQESIDAIAEGVVTFVAEQVRPIFARLHALEQERENGVSNVRWAGVF